MGVVITLMSLLVYSIGFGVLHFVCKYHIWNRHDYDNDNNDVRMGIFFICLFWPVTMWIIIGLGVSRLIARRIKS